MNHIFCSWRVKEGGLYHPEDPRRNPGIPTIRKSYLRLLPSKMPPSYPSVPRLYISDVEPVCPFESRYDISEPQSPFFQALMRIEYRLDRLSERMDSYHKDVLDVRKMSLCLIRRFGFVEDLTLAFVVFSSVIQGLGGVCFAAYGFGCKFYVCGAGRARLFHCVKETDHAESMRISPYDCCFLPVPPHTTTQLLPKSRKEPIFTHSFQECPTTKK